MDQLHPSQLVLKDRLRHYFLEVQMVRLRPPCLVDLRALWHHYQQGRLAQTDLWRLILPDLTALSHRLFLGHLTVR